MAAGRAGGEKEKCQGGGYGLRVRPVGVYVIQGETVTWRPALDPSRALVALLSITAIALLCKHRHSHRHHRHGGCCRKSAHHRKPCCQR